MNAASLSTYRARWSRERQTAGKQRVITGEAEPYQEAIETLVVAAVEPQRPDSEKKRILLVDDDERVLTSVALVLEGERYDVILASNGYEAATQCQRHPPDLIVIDLNMPLKDGWATLETIEGLRPFMPMIVITARPLQYERAIAFGVDALMEKPLDFPVLLAEIERLLNEPEHERLARLTGQNFRTIKLSSGSARK